VGEAGLNKSFEKGMWFVRFALKLGMILAGDEIRMVAQLDQLRERAIRGCSRDCESFFGHAVAIFHVEFITVAVSLEHVGFAINFFGKRAGCDLCRPRAKPHARAFIAHSTLLLEQRDDRLRNVPVEFSAVRVFDSADVSRELNCCHLHAEAETEVRHLMFASEPRRLDFSLDAALAESARN